MCVSRRLVRPRAVRPEVSRRGSTAGRRARREDLGVGVGASPTLLPCPRQFSARGGDRRDDVEAPAATMSARRHFPGLAPEVGDQFCRPRERSVLPTLRRSVTPFHHTLAGRLDVDMRAQRVPMRSRGHAGRPGSRRDARTRPLLLTRPGSVARGGAERRSARGRRGLVDAGELADRRRRPRQPASRWGRWVPRRV